MAYTSQPWPYVEGEGPSYSAEDWRAMYQSMGGPAAPAANAGVIYTSGFPLRVLASDPASMQTVVQPGAAFINGLFAVSDTEVTITHSPASPTYRRWDLVVFRYDVNMKTVEIACREGTPAAAPLLHDPVQDDDPYYEIPLAAIYVTPGMTAITAQDIQDKRVFHNAASDALLVPSYGNPSVDAPVVWDPPATDARHARYHTIDRTDSTTYEQLVAGVLQAKDAAYNGLVLSRGVVRLYANTDVTPGDLIAPDFATGGSTSVQSLRRALSCKPIGVALTGVTGSGSIMAYIDPPAFWSVPRRRIVHDVSGSNSTVTTTATLLPLGPIQFAPRTRWVEVELVGCCSISTAGQSVQFYVYVDDVDKGLIWQQAAAAGYRQMVTARVTLDLTAAGNHEFKVMWKTTGGTGTFYFASGEVEATWSVRELFEIY